MIGEDVYVFAPLTSTTRVTLRDVERTTVTIFKACSEGGAIRGPITVEKPTVSTDQVEFYALPGDEVTFQRRVADPDGGFF